MKNQTDSRFHNSLLLAAFGFLIIFSFIATDYYFNYDSAKVSALENASPKSYEREKRFQRFLTLLGQQLHSIRNFPDFSNFLEGKVSKDHAENYFLNIAQTQGNIMQLRYLDASGHERIRVDQLAANTFKTFKIKDLQDKSHRDYFIEGKTKPIDQVWYSRVDLNIEQGVVEVPFKPTLRVIMPLGKDGQFSGMLVMNVYMQEFIDELMRMPLYSPVLLNADGEILWHSDAELNWSAYQQKPFTIFKFYPQLTSVLDKSKPYKDSDRFVRRLDLPLAQDLYLWFEVNPVYLQAERVRYQQSLTVVSAFVALFTFLAILFFSKLNARLYDQVLRSKAQFEAMFKKHSAVMLLIDPDNGDIKEANTSACKFYGYSPEQFSKKNIQSLNEIDQANLPETLSKLQGAGTEPYHFVHRLSSGEYRDVEVDASLIDTEDGNLIFEIIKDVTQEKKNKANLKEILSRMALASEVANFGVWQWNYESGELVWDKQMHRIYGVPESQEVDRYQQWHDAVHSDDIASAEEKINLAAKGDVDFMTEFRIIRPSGEVRTILAVGRSQRDEQGVPTSMVGINMDITKQKLLEIQARQERSIADTIIDHAPMIIALVNSKGVMVRLNHYGEKFVGFTQDEVSKEAYFWSRFIPKSLRSKVTEFVQSAQSGQLPPKFINPWIGKDGHERTFEWTNLSLNDEASNGNYILAIGVDISEEEAIKENLLVSVKNAEQSNNLKSEFLANMSHEIRTPLNGIIGLTNLMLKTPLNLQQRDYIEQSLQSSKTLLRILNDILDYSKIEANRLDLDVQAFSLEQILQNSISLFSYAANQKGLELHIDLSTDLYISMLGDSLRIEQIFNNLLGNAIKFTNEGDITIQAFARSVTESDAEIEFRVMDTGIGIPEEKVQHLFEAFNQADTSYTRKYGGTGLGLSITKRLVEMMGGELWVESVEGEGSTFGFTLKFKLAPKKGQALDLEMFKNLRFLVVDDNTIQLQQIGKILSSWGLEHVLCNTQESAQEALRDKVYDYWLIDWTLPINDGLDLLESFTNAYGKPKSSILLIVAEQEGLVLEQARKRGISFTKSLRKPVTASVLYDVIVQDNYGSDYQELPKLNYSTGEIKVNARILVAEDNPVNQLVIREYLEEYGAEVVLAENGQECLKRFQEADFDLVLMDIQMPVMNGYEAAKAIRELNSETPIIALSAAVMLKDKQTTMDVGMNAHLSKPIDPQALESSLIQFLPLDKVRLNTDRRISEHDKTNITGEIDQLTTLLPDATEWVDIQGLVEQYTKAEKVLQILVLFAESSERLVNQIKQNKDDIDAVLTALHALKGASANLLMQSLAEQIEKLEQDINQYQLNSSNQQQVDLIINQLHYYSNSILKANLLLSEKKVDSIEQIPDKRIFSLAKELMSQLEQSRFIDSEFKADFLEKFGINFGKQKERTLQNYLDMFDYEKALQMIKDSLKKGKRDE